MDRKQIREALADNMKKIKERLDKACEEGEDFEVLSLSDAYTNAANVLLDDLRRPAFGILTCDDLVQTPTQSVERNTETEAIK